MVELQPDKALIFRITHYTNLPWIIENGLWSLESGHLDPNFRTIGNPDIIGKRKSRIVPIQPGGTLCSYIPFYFTPWSMMLYNILTGYGVKKEPPDDIIFLIASLHDLAEKGQNFVFTDRHAYLKLSRYASDLDELESHIDWDLLRRRDFRIDPEDPSKTERYQAEALVYEHIGIDSLLGIACNCKRAQEILTKELDKHDVATRLEVRGGWYFP